MHQRKAHASEIKPNNKHNPINKSSNKVLTLQRQNSMHDNKIARTITTKQMYTQCS